MTSIQKMAIQGVRAFSPHQEQTIEFYKPLTMIVGANGCGKTTIIECLKYVCTGTPPPGGDKGKSFVHDPKIAGVPEVKASIKLRFKNRAGQDMVVNRLLQLTQKKTTSTFKTLDGVIKSTDPRTGEKTAMSHKCGELDKQIPYLMGVSKAIMENVIFCHQEESSWPLGDSASLKKKFDDIFESSRYSKALQTIRATKLDYNNKAKEMKAELASLDAYREQAEDIKKDLEGLEKTTQRYQAREAQYTADLAQVEEELEHHAANGRVLEEKRAAHQRKNVELGQEQARLAATLASLGEGQRSDEPAEFLREKLAALEAGEAEAGEERLRLNEKKRSPREEGPRGHRRAQLVHHEGRVIAGGSGAGRAGRQKAGPARRQAGRVARVRGLAPAPRTRPRRPGLLG